MGTEKARMQEVDQLLDQQAGVKKRSLCSCTAYPNCHKVSKVDNNREYIAAFTKMYII
jgi:hypothetical protein